MESVRRSDVPARRSLALLRIFLVIALVLTRAAVAASDAALNGHWEGSMTSQGAQLSVSVDFTQTDSGIEGRFTSPTQQAMDYPLDSVSIAGSSVHFILGGSITFDGQVTAEAVRGIFKSDEASGSFALAKKETPKLPYHVADVTFDSGDVRLSGTLVSPPTSGRHPAVVLLQGSGSETRWGTNRFIADRLARAGVAALIYDKRGSGASGGDWKTATYEDLAQDAWNRRCRSGKSRTR